MAGFDELKKFADEHDRQVDEGLQKGGDAAGERFGHEEQIDKVVEQAQQRTGEGDTAP
jgi:hypothetical protein